MDTEAFVRWAMDGRRTVEERYTTELVVEQGVTWWETHRKDYRGYDPARREERRRQRLLNPAYEPRYTETAVRQAAETLPGIKSWSFHGYQERLVRNLGVLRFLTDLEVVSVSDSEVTDLEPLTELPRLRELHLMSTRCTDYRPLARCRQLRTLHLTLWRTYLQPGTLWPEVAGLEQLDQLENLLLEGNLLAFPPGIVWPRVRTAVLRCQPLPARNVHDLPQLPACEFLTLGGVETLEGIAALPHLRNLRVETSVRDFAPLAALEKLTCFSCGAFEPQDVTPLTRLPQLQCATFDANFQFLTKPQPLRDFSALGNAPRLRELHVKGCPPVALEVAALNALLPPWDDVFLAATPRPLAPGLRLIVAPAAKTPRGDPVQFDPGDNGLVDAGLRECEGRWVGRFVANNISAALGASDWGKAEANGPGRGIHVTIEAFAVVEKLPLIMQAIRASVARLKSDYCGGLTIWLKAPTLIPTPAQKQLLEQFRDEQDQAEYERHRREQQEYLERMHHYELKKQLGEPIHPEEFSPAAPEPLPPPPWEVEEEEEDDDSGDDGDVATAVKKKPDPPPNEFDDDHPLNAEYRLWAVFNLNELWVDPRQRDLVVYLLGREPDVVIPEDKKPD